MRADAGEKATAAVEGFAAAAVAVARLGSAVSRVFFPSFCRVWGEPLTVQGAEFAAMYGLR